MKLESYVSCVGIMSGYQLFELELEYLNFPYNMMAPINMAKERV